MATLLVVCLFLTFFGGSNACVYLTVSSLPPDLLEVNWNCPEPIRMISVYDEDPRQHTVIKPIAEISVADYPEGFCKTNVTFKAEPFPRGWSKNFRGSRDPKNHCLYWMVVYYHGSMAQFDCFKIQPAWMTENRYRVTEAVQMAPKVKLGICSREELKNLSLPFMFLPGTHNSGTDSMKTTRKRSVSHLDNFVLTQDQSVWNQLVYGIRFLDFRVGYYPQGSDPSLRFWINHDMLRVQPLIPVLRDVVEFSTASPGEIIILDFHRFPTGFRTKNAPEIHKQLIDLIGREMKNLLIPRPVSQSKLKLEDIWATDRRIVVSYSEENFIWETPWLWTSVSQRWGNKQTPEALEKFLDITFRDVAPRKLWAAMAELTPTPLDFLSNGSLRSMADRVNRKLSNWFSERQNWTSRANIVAVDFFRGTNLIAQAIDENLRRGKLA